MPTTSGEPAGPASRTARTHATRSSSMARDAIQNSASRLHSPWCRVNSFAVATIVVERDASVSQESLKRRIRSCPKVAHKPSHNFWEVAQKTPNNRSTPAQRPLKGAANKRLRHSPEVPQEWLDGRSTSCLKLASHPPTHYSKVAHKTPATRCAIHAQLVRRSSAPREPLVFVLPRDTRSSNVERNKLDRMHCEFHEFGS